jgi:hypothetical protein
MLLMSLTAACVEKEEAVKGKRPAGAERKAEGISIARIITGVEAYRDKEVTVSGTVTPGLAFEFVDEQPYLLRDDTGEVWVITKSVMPEEGSWTTVKGTLRSPYQIKGRSYETAIIELERK